MTRKDQQISAFRISYWSHDPRVAQKVTGELTDLFIGENLKTRQQQSEGTTQFLESQLSTARASLAEQEAKVSQFQANNAGTLPAQQASNLQILSGLQSATAERADWAEHGSAAAERTMRRLVEIPGAA